MISLRNFTVDDAKDFQQNQQYPISIEKIQSMFVAWNQKEYSGKYFEMFAITRNEAIVGSLSLFQLSENMISCGPEIFDHYRRQGIASEAMLLAMNIARNKGYQIVLQQIRSDNTASIALHSKLGFETDGYCYKNKKGNDIFIYLKSLSSPI